MPEWIKVVFDGIGTEIISLIAGSILGGAVGFRIGEHKSKATQSQKAGSNSEQYQKSIPVHDVSNNTNIDYNSKSFIRQLQKAKDNSKQTQIRG